jgi:hypothetical protein
VKFLPQKSLCDTFYDKSVKKFFWQNWRNFRKTCYNIIPFRFSLIFIVKEEHEDSETTSKEKNGRYFDRKSGKKFNKQYN